MVLGGMLELEEVLAVVAMGGSSLTVPTTQYESFGFSSGQSSPGLRLRKSSTDNPQLLERDSQVAPLSADVEKAQSTPRRT